MQLPNGSNGANYKNDFIDGALHECGVGTIAWGTIFAYDDKAFVDNKPSSIADFFDTKSFPGPRAIRKDPSVIMEWALLADGASPDEVYSLLETTQGMERAFAVLDRIKPNIL